MRFRGLTLAVAATALAAGCGGGEDEVSAGGGKRRSGPQALMYGVEVRQAIKGRVEVEIIARRAWHSRTAEWIDARGVKARYFPEKGEPSRMRAHAVRYRVSGRWLEARGRVRVESEGTVLESETLQYDAERRKIFTRDFVTITRGDNVMTGQGLEADPDLKSLQMVRPHIRLEDPEEARPLVERLDEKGGRNQPEDGMIQ